MNIRFKKVLSIILIISMVATSAGFNTFAEGVSELIQNQTIDANSEDLSKKYIEEEKENFDSERGGSVGEVVNYSEEEGDTNKILEEKEEEDNPTEPLDKSDPRNLEEEEERDAIIIEQSIEPTEGDNTNSESTSVSTDSEIDSDEVLDVENETNADEASISEVDVDTASDSETEVDAVGNSDADIKAASNSEALETPIRDVKGTSSLVSDSETSAASDSEIRLELIGKNKKATVNELETNLFGATNLGDYSTGIELSDGSHGYVDLNFGQNWYENLGFTLPKEQIEEVRLDWVVTSRAQATTVPTCDEYRRVICQLPYPRVMSGDYCNIVDPDNPRAVFFWVYRTGTTLTFRVFVTSRGSSYFWMEYSLFNGDAGIWNGFQGLKRIVLPTNIRYGEINYMKPGVNITNLQNYFSNCSNLESISGVKLNVNGCTSAQSMFEGCTHLTSVGNTLNNAGSIINAKSMFRGCTSLTSLPTLIRLTALQNCESMFEGCTSLQQVNMPSFSNATNLKGAFKDCTNLKTITVPADVRMMPTGCDTTDMFRGCTSLVGGGGFRFDLRFTDGTYARVDYGGIYPGYLTCTDNSIYDSLNVTIDSSWSNNVTKANIKKIKFSQDELMESFGSNFNLPTSMNNTLGYVQDGGETLYIHFARQLRKLKTVANWTNFFASFTNLESIEGLDLIDTQVVTNITGIFKNCTHLQSVALEDIDIRNIITAESAFENCTSLTVLTGNIASFSSLQNAKNAFKGCTSLPVFSFGICDTPTLADISGIFDGCTALTTIYVDDNYQGLPSGVVSTNMFRGCTSLVGGEGFSYNAVAPITDGSVANVDYGGIKPGYFTIHDTSKYADATFTLPTNWYNLHAEAVKPKREITTIKFYNDSTGIGSYDSYYYMSDTDLTRFYIDGNTVKIHYGHNMPKLKVTGDFSGFFKDFTNLTTIEGLEKLNVSEVEDMSELFSGCENLTRLDLSNFSSDKVTNVTSMFKNNKKLTTIVASSSFAVKDKTGNDMFLNCDSLVGSRGTAYRTALVNDSSYAQVDHGVGNPGYFTWDGDIDAIAVKTMPMTSYRSGEAFNPAGLVITVRYTDGSTGDISYAGNEIAFSFNPVVINVAGNVVVTYRGKTENIPVTIDNEKGTSGDSGSGSGGGNGNGLGPIAAGISNVDFIIHTPISLSEYRWVYDEIGERDGVEIRKDSNLGRNFINSTDFTNRWQVIEDESYIKLKNGFYLMEYSGGLYYFAFDNNAKMITGFVQTTTSTEHRYIDITTHQFTKSFSQPSAKYFLYSGIGIYRGIMWALPIAVNNVVYTFDEQGRVIKEDSISTNGTLLQENICSNWQYNPVTNRWKYYNVDASGRGEYYTNGIYPIVYLGETRYYSFDSVGNMETGLKQIDGNVYYLQETGDFIGAVYTGAITLNGQTCYFDAQGRMVNG